MVFRPRKGSVTRVLIVEDNERHAELITDELTDNQIADEVVWAPTAEQGLEKLEESSCDLILLDYRLPEMDGLDFLEEIRRRGNKTPVVFVTTADSIELAVKAMKLGAEDFVQKQEGYLEVLPLMIQEAVDRIRLRDQKTRLEEQLRQSERLASVGILAAGFAHNINNRLTSLKTFFELQSGTDGAPPIEKSFVEICRQDLERVVMLVQELTRYAFSEDSIERLPEPMAELILRAIGHVEDDAARKNVTIVQKFESVPRIPVEAEGIKQLLINLLRNAVEVSPPKSEVEVRLVTRPGKDHDEIVVHVCDSGPGVPNDVRDKVFDPFFTTKDHGLGIGLYLCHKIASQHRGRIQVGDSEGGGATFSVFLPVPAQSSTESSGLRA